MLAVQEQQIIKLRVHKHADKQLYAEHGHLETPEWSDRFSHVIYTQQQIHVQINTKIRISTHV